MHNSVHAEKRAKNHCYWIHLNELGVLWGKMYRNECGHFSIVLFLTVV